jgi:tetratricopeptide (TPR) repeat protein
MDEAWHAATTYYREGNSLWRAGRAAEAVECYRRALGFLPNHPDILLNLGNALLCLGCDAEGWAAYQYRAERRQSLAQGLGFPEWRGESLAGKRLFIWTEQGLGDHIFAARFALNLEAAKTTMVAPAQLAGLFSQLPLRVIPRTFPTSVEPDYDFWTLPLSLPQWVKPAPTPYLSANPRAASSRIGVMSRGNALPDPNRSLPDDIAQHLLALTGAVSLHPEDTGAVSFLDTAEIIAGLDLVISIDTSVAHLAGAMGKPVWIMLHHESHDWRWRGVPPWYPTAEFYRQPFPGDWLPVIEAIGQRVASERTDEPNGDVPSAAISSRKL